MYFKLSFYIKVVIITLIVTFVGILFFIGSIKMIKCKKMTYGTLENVYVSVSTDEYGSSTKAKYDVKYIVDGKEYRLSSEDHKKGSEKERTGERVKVYYDPNNPKLAYDGNIPKEYVYGGEFIGIVVFIMLVYVGYSIFGDKNTSKKKAW